MRKAGLLVLGAMTLAGCSTTAVTNTAQISYVTIPPNLAEIASRVPVHQNSGGLKVVANVTALACQRLTSDPLPTEEYALALLKEEAMKVQGTGVIDVSYSRGGVHFTANCWNYISASGKAVRATLPQSPES